VIRIVLVDDQALLRAGFRALIEPESDLDVVGEASDGREALDAIRSTKPDVVLMDINLPRMSGIECVRKLKSLLPTIQILMLTVYEDSDKIFDSLLAGASGYLLKRTPQAEILEAIRGHIQEHQRPPSQPELARAAHLDAARCANGSTSPTPIAAHR